MIHRLPKACVSLAALLLVAACSGATPGSAAPASAQASAASAAPTAAGTVSPNPITTASFSGTYQVVRKITAMKDFGFLYKVGAVEKRTYAVTPSCASGPCDVSIVVTGSKSGKPATLVFKLTSGVYTYDAAVPTAQFHCTVKKVDYHQLTETTKTGLTPTETAVVGGALVITKLSFATHYEVTPTGKAKTAGCKPFSVDMTGSVDRDPAT